MLSVETIKKNMLSLLKNLEQNYIPDFCRKPIYLTLVGSRVSGLSTEESDVDIIGVVIPPRVYYDPVKCGFVHEFDNVPRFQQWKLHGYPIGEVEYDITIYSLPRYFRLCLDGNINIVETLFTDPQYQLITSFCSDEFLKMRKDFLSMNCFYKFMGFANAHKKRLVNRRGRQDYVNKYGFDTKEAAFLIRAYEQCLRLLKTQDIVCDIIPHTVLSIKKGEMLYDQVLSLADLLEKECERWKDQSLLREKPDMDKFRKFLLGYLT